MQSVTYGEGITFLTVATCRGMQQVFETLLVGHMHVAECGSWLRRRGCGGGGGVVARRQQQQLQQRRVTPIRTAMMRR